MTQKIVEVKPRQLVEGVSVDFSFLSFSKTTIDIRL